MRRRRWAWLPCLVALGPLGLLAQVPTFPEPHDSEKSKARPLPAAEAARGFRVPDGFHVDVFASEPEVRNPIAMTWDGRGRLWVAENFTYAESARKFDLSLRDRVLVFTDRDGDGHPESRHVFFDDLQRLTSVEVGRGGVWVMCPPRLLFLPDRDGDDRPDGPPEVVLDGFNLPPENYHNFANGLRWGPDGWLYGRCGGSAPGKVRRPDEPPEAAVPLQGGAWRYHPTRKVFEALCHGTTNPWGHDWTLEGEAFLCNSVTGHLWHVIPGGHYRRSSTLDPNPLVYEPMDMTADHWHFDTGKGWVASRQLTTDTDRLGGGHAHAGLMVYLGDQWPAAYRGRLLMFNLHGRRANAARLERGGCGYIGRREPDMLFAADLFFRGMDLRYGPDGSVFCLDWSDTGECHEHDGVHRNSGRIYRVRYGTPPAIPAPDLGLMGVSQLVDLHSHRNEWFVRQARLELANRPEASTREMRSSLVTLVRQSPDSVRRLRALWTLHTVGFSEPAILQPLLDDPNEHVRTWTIRLLSDSWLLDTAVSQSRAEKVNVPPDVFDRFVRMAAEDASGLVRLTLASTLQRLPIALRPRLAAALLGRPEDAADPKQPLLVWYGLIPVVKENPEAMIALAGDGKFPLVRQWTARRFAETLATHAAPLDGLLSRTRDGSESVRRDVVLGMSAGLAGVRQARVPTSWAGYSRLFRGTDADHLRTVVATLDVVFGDGRALDEVQRLALDDKADLKLRQAALRSLIDAGAPELRAVCERLLRVRFLNTVALDGLTRFDDPAVGRLMAKSYRTFHPSERGPVISALASRATFAGELLDQIAAGTISRADLTALQARQIRGFNDATLTAKLTKVWGELRDSPKDKADLIAKLRSELTPAHLAAGDRKQGRALFVKHCANCHRLFGSGEEIGPDLTGSGRKDLDYLLPNLVDPSAVVNQDYQTTALSLTDGRLINGVVVAETERTLTVQTGQARLMIPRDQVEDRRRLPQSLMPDGLLQAMTADQIRDLVAYLVSDSQVVLPKDR